jgi:carboxyl-terminal processing protease
VAGNGISNDKIRRMLRGPGSSKVIVTLLRVGEAGRPREITITRGTIPLPSVDVAYMINKETGYIRINKFSETTHAEFAQALMKLQSQGLQRSSSI